MTNKNVKRKKGNSSSDEDFFNTPLTPVLILTLRSFFSIS